MHSLRLSSILAFHALAALGSPHPATLLHPRHADSLSQPPIASIIATVTSPNGTDITSTFQTLLYHGTTVVAPSNLTERQAPVTIRPINFCSRENAEFDSSECDYRASFRHSLQRYRVRCHLLNSRQDNARNSFIAELGFCNPDEICVNGVRDARGNPTLANCVGQRSFEKIPNYDSPEGKEKLEQILEDKTASAVVSQMDRQTALSVESLEIDAGVAGVGRVGGQVGLTSQEKCSDCVEVATGKLGEGTDFLSTEVTVSAGAAAAGILWLAVLSG